ncbi:MAG: aldo/keto reductase [Proteobacteria bacterium]|nr:aldo/keto reductase [Pseudomonadota bacterium]
MNNLELIELGAGGPRFTRMGMGCWAIGGHGWGTVNDDDSIKAIRHAYERGLTFFDTADCYGLGKSERILRQSLGDNLKSLFVATKGGVRWDESGRVWNDSSPAYLRTAVEASLQRLGLERIPLYYLHKLDGRTSVSEIMNAFVRLREEGKIGEIGVANFSVAQLEEALKVAPVRVVQDRFNLLQRDRGLEFADICRNSGVLLVGWGALADGLLTGKFDRWSTFGEDDHRSRLPAFAGKNFSEALQRVLDLQTVAQRRGVSLSQLALRWVMDIFPWTCPLFGAKTVSQVEENIGADGWKLTSEEMVLIDEFSGWLCCNFGEK